MTAQECIISSSSWQKFCKVPTLICIRGLINKFVDRDYNLKTIQGKTKCALCLITGLFCSFYIKLYVILTSDSAINEL